MIGESWDEGKGPGIYATTHTSAELQDTGGKGRVRRYRKGWGFVNSSLQALGNGLRGIYQSWHFEHPKSLTPRSFQAPGSRKVQLLLQQGERGSW